MSISKDIRSGRRIASMAYLGLLLLLLHLSLATASQYFKVMGDPPIAYELVCPEHEELQDTVPCCEPTCDNDCSSAKCGDVFVQEPTCVCKRGYVRHKGKCIPRSQCPSKPSGQPTCAENEELLPSPPSCEPTCTDDCSGRSTHSRYVDQPTCVCKKGYRRHNGKCVRADQCPTCGPYATLKSRAPCCEPTCENDCSNVLCINAYQGEDPVCVCQDGYVKHNSTCIKRELCPNTGYPAPKQYCRCNGRRKAKCRASVPVNYGDPLMNPGSCNRYKTLDVVAPDFYPSPVYPAVTPCPSVYPSAPAYQSPMVYSPPAPPSYVPPAYSPPAYVPPPTSAPANYAPAPYVPVYATTCAPPVAGSQAYVSPSAYAPPPPGPYMPPVYNPSPVYVNPSYVSPSYEPVTYAPAKPYYPQVASSYQDQPYYAIPALQQCSCSLNSNLPAGSPPYACNSSRIVGAPVRAPCACNNPPISYNVATSTPCVTSSPMTTPCPPLLGVYNPMQPVAYNSVPYQNMPFVAPYPQDQAYVKAPATTNAPAPVDVSYIALPGTGCPGATTPAPCVSLSFPPPLSVLGC